MLSLTKHVAPRSFRANFHDLRSSLTLFPCHSLLKNDAACVVAASDRFTFLLSAFRATGGTVSADSLVRLMSRYRENAFINIGRMMETHSISHFHWRDVAWIPTFQLNKVDLSVVPEIGSVVETLSETMDDWSVAEWFVKPNEKLGNYAPADITWLDMPAVVSAAISEKFRSQAEIA